MPKSRLEAFSDGVFAIAATLLVLELQVPRVGSGPLWPQLLAAWPSYAVYVVSFLTIGIIWVNHHALFALIRQVDRPILFLNLLLLMMVSLVPFPTALLGEWITDEQEAHVAGAVYGLVFLLMGVPFGQIWRYTAARPELVHEALGTERARRALWRLQAGELGYLLGIGLAFMSGLASLVVYALVALYYVAPNLPDPRRLAGARRGEG
jgi:uncharacterized membrane protein